MVFPIKEKFSLTDKFLNSYKRRKVNWGPLGYITFKRTYSRNGEEWWETCKRVVEGCYTTQLTHCKHFRLPWNAHKSQKSAQKMYALMFDFKFLPPGRGLWMMGTEYVWERGAAALQNCAMVSTENLATEGSEPFCFLMDMSLLGVGVSFDTKGAGQVTIVQPKVNEGEVFVAKDSKEGWVSVIERILDSYFGKAKLPSEFDLSQIRPAGSPIKTFGGIAPGAGPLKRAMEEIQKILENNIDEPISSTVIVDLMNIVGKCVVSGGVRRTAELALGNSDDDAYISIKQEDPGSWRWASNNSVFAEIGGTDYTKLCKFTATNGEPGFVWLDNCRHYGRFKDGYGDYDLRVVGVNPCAEQSLESYELCNLVETFPSRHETWEEYRETLKYAYLYAKTVTLIPTHNEKTNQIMTRNRRIGLSQSGIIEAFNKHGRREHFCWCDKGYNYVRNLDNQYSEWLGIPRSIKVTTVKPSGTVSLLPGVTPGIHYEHSEYYYRTIRIDKSSPLLTDLEKSGYKIEESSNGDNTMVVYFPVQANNFKRGKREVTIWEQLENAAAMQYYWCDNQVSITVTFDKKEIPELVPALEMYESRLKAVSFLPLSDHEYKQAPYQTISKETYEEYINELKRLKLEGNTHEQDDNYCDGGRCAYQAGI